MFVFLPICLMATSVAFAAEPLKIVDFGFEEGFGSYSDDASGARRSAEFTPSAKWAVGAFGAALATGEREAGALIGPIPDLNGSSPFTVFLRFRREGAGFGPHPCLLSTSDWGNGGLLFFAAHDALTIRLRAGANGPENGITAFATIPEGKWCSVALVVSRPNVSVYANGKLVRTQKWDHPFTAKRFSLGQWGSNSFGGFLDDFRVWKGVLTAAQIAEMANDSRFAEVEGYQDDGTGGVQKTQVREQTVSGDAPVAMLDNEYVTLTFDAGGAISSLREKATGRELVTNPVPFALAQIKGEGQVIARRFEKRASDRFAWRFPFGMGELEMRVTPFAGGWAFKATACTLKDVSRMTFLRVRPACAEWAGTFVNAMSDAQSAVCVRSGDTLGEPSVAGGVLGVIAAEPFPVVGRTAYLAAGPREGFVEQLRSMAKAAGVPTSDCGGPWSMGSEVSRWSYVFAPVVRGDVDYWINFTKRAGFSLIHFNSTWTSCLGHYPVNRNAFPGGLEEMKAAADKIHAAGLHVGMHTLTACINPRDPWITPVCETNLVADATYTLAAPLAEDAKELLVEEKPIPRHATVFTYSSNGNALRIGNEILQYTGIRRDSKPYAFTGLTRGAFGTKKGGMIPRGASVDYLHQRYIAFYPKPDSPLADALADRLAEVYNTCGLDEFYFDGSEGMGSRYGIDAMRHKIYRRLKPNNGHSPSIEASCQGANNWWFQTRTATTDHGVYGVKRFHDFHIKWGVRQGRLMNFLEPQMGWWQPRTDVPRARGHFLDEMEYFAGKNAGHDAAMSLQGVNARPLPIGVRRQLTVLGWYEYARLARVFTPEAIARLSGEQTEARLRQNAQGVWELEDVEEFKHRAGFAWTRDTTFESARARSAALRVEALYSAAPAGSGVPLVKAEDFTRMEMASANGVKAEFKADAAGERKAFRLTATNKGAEQNAAWARAQLKFAFPGADVGKNRIAFGMWVKGDGSGALLNLQLSGVREYIGGISDHLVRLDFTGWKYVTILLRERDAGEFWKYAWPYPGGYALGYRSMVGSDHLESFTAYLNDIPEGRTASVEIGAVEALEMVPGPTLTETAVAVNGTRVAVPFTLKAGEYAELDDGLWTHYSAMGTAQGTCPAKAAVALKKGVNAVALVAPPDVRAEITLFARDNRRPALAANLSPSARKTMRYEGVMPFEYAPAKGLLPPAVLPVRPGETARLEIEVMGPAKNPSFTLPSAKDAAKKTFTFPAAIAADEKLVCTDGLNWEVVKIANGKKVAKGALEAEMPLLTASIPFAFAAELAENGSGCEVDLLKHYVDATPAKVASVPKAEFAVRRDVPYYPAAAYTNDYMQTFCKMHLRTPTNVTGFATVVWFHGGGLIHGSRGSFYRTPQDDVASVSAGYRLLTNATPAECLADAGAVVAWTLKHIAEYGGDPKKVFLSGSSGGGYLSLMVGMDPKWLAPHGFKPTDLAGLLPQTGQASTHFTIRSVNGDKTSTYITKVDEWAPLFYAARDLPPMLIQTGEPEIDIPCRAEENKLLYASLKALGHADLEHHAYAGRRHGTMSQDVTPFESDFIHRRIRQIDGVPFSTGDNPMRTCLERAVAEGLATDVVSLVSDCAYAHDEVCVQRKGNRTDMPGDGAWLVPLLARVARASLQADGKSLPAPGAPLKQINRKIPWVTDTYTSALFTRVIDPLGMKDTKLVVTKKGESPRWVTTAEDALRVAELIARKGAWHGRRLFPATAALPLPFAFDKRLFAEANGEAGVLFTVRDVAGHPAFDKLTAEWRAVAAEKNR